MIVHGRIVWFSHRYTATFAVTHPLLPRPQTLHRLSDNLQYLYWIASLYVAWYGWEVTHSSDAKWAQSDYWKANQDPRNIQKCTFCENCGPYMTNWWLFLGGLRVANPTIRLVRPSVRQILGQYMDNSHTMLWLHKYMDNGDTIHGQ